MNYYLVSLQDLTHEDLWMIFLDRKIVPLERNSTIAISRRDLPDTGRPKNIVIKHAKRIDDDQSFESNHLNVIHMRKWR